VSESRVCRARATREPWNGRRSCAVAVVALGTLLVLGACTSHRSESSAGSETSAGSASTSGPSAGPTVPAKSASPAPAPRSQPAAQSAHTRKVSRSGQPLRPTISAAAAPFDGAAKVSYPDGVTVKINSITQGSVEGSGPGTIGGPKTTFDLVFTNDSDKPVDMSQVVVTVAYGPRHLQARPVYDAAGQSDFAGNIKPGKSAHATYAFSIPVASLDDVTMWVDFDGLHTSAVFTGKVGPR
jgi:hypothetical protein